MWIKRLEVSGWRGLNTALEDLSPGLNLVAGPNESGKSRLAQALRFALFESSKGQSAHKRDLSSWGVDPERPRVRVEFELGGVRWRLEKVFLGSGCNTELRSDDAGYSGEEAETRLAELLGLPPAGRKERDAGDRGLWTLLWVEQGESRAVPQHNTTSQSRIADRLALEVGEAAAGAVGQRLLARAETECNRWYTPDRGAERPVLRDARRELEERREQLARARARRDEIAGAADKLEHARNRVAGLEQRVESARRHRTEQAERSRLAGECRHLLAQAESDLRESQQARAEARKTLEDAQSLRKQADTVSNRLQIDTASLAGQETERTRAQARVDAAATEADGCESALQACDRRIAGLRRRQQMTVRREELARLREQQAAGARLRERREIATRALGELPAIGADEVAGLRRALKDRDGHRARLDGASATLALTAHTDLLVDGDALSAGDTRRVVVAENRRVEIDGVLTLEVNPGGGEIARLRDALRDAERELASRLQAAGADDVEQAERIAQHRRDTEAELARVDTELAERVPQGLDALADRMSELQAALDAAGDDTDAQPFDEKELAAAEREAVDLTEARSAARLRRDSEAARLADLREQVAAARSGVDAARAQHAALVQKCDTLPSPQTLLAQYEALDATCVQRTAARDEAGQRFEASGGERAATDLEQADKALAGLQSSLQAEREQCVRLETTLETAGDDGRHEAVQVLEAELKQAEDTLARLLREALAARRLHELLSREYRAARERLTQPVIERIRPYLAELFPGSGVWLDEDLQLCGLRSERVEEQFEALSGGAREQLALLVRIGLAEVLGTDEPWPLVLDDVLVNTDAERIRAMQRALYHAGQKMQILLFTCHGPLFDTLGPNRYLELPAQPRSAGP